MYGTNCTNEAIIKIIGRVTQEFSEFEDLQKQIKLRNTLEESLYKYDIITKETSLIASDIEEKIEIFFASKKLEGMSSKTEKNYRYILVKFASYLKKPISSVTTMDMRMYLSVIGKGLKPGTVNAIIYCFKSFFSWLVNNEYIFKNPMYIIKATKVPKRIRHPLSDEDAELLRIACKKIREKAMVELFLSSGMRLSELCDINKENVNWQEMSINVIGKGNKERFVYFNTKAKIFLQQYINSRTDTNPALFVAEKRPYGRLHGRGVEVAVKRIADRIDGGRHIFPHLLRHTFATQKINAGMPLNIIQDLMGHESPSTTLIYAQISKSNIKHEYNKTC